MINGRSNCHAKLAELLLFASLVAIQAPDVATVSGAR